MKKSKLGFSWVAFIGLAFSVCGCPVTLMVSNSTNAFIVGVIGLAFITFALLTNRFRVFG